VQDLFDCPTVAALAQRIDSGHVNNSLRHNQVVETTRNNGEVSLSFAQERLWFLEQLQPGQGFNNIPVAIRLKGELNRVALGKSLNEIVRRHEVFRVAFSNRKGQPAARLSSAGEVPLPVINLTHFPAAEREAQARQEAESEGRRPFDLSEGRLLRAKLLEIDTCDHLLLITTHHIVSDGWSMAILYRELRRLYDAFRQGLASPLPELPIQYPDFAWQQRRGLQGNVLEEQLAYWKEQLKGRLPPLELPTDRPRPPVQTYRGTTHFFMLPPSLAGALKKLSRR